eukprot:1138443-Pelagomonas_calceolata.AAC.6
MPANLLPLDAPLRAKYFSQLDSRAGCFRESLRRVNCRKPPTQFSSLFSLRILPPGKGKGTPRAEELCTLLHPKAKETHWLIPLKKPWVSSILQELIIWEP